MFIIQKLCPLFHTLFSLKLGWYLGSLRIFSNLWSQFLWPFFLFLKVCKQVSKEVRYSWEKLPCLWSYVTYFCLVYVFFNYASVSSFFRLKITFQLFSPPPKYLVVSDDFVISFCYFSHTELHLEQFSW